jgi:hypothetical protein
MNQTKETRRNRRAIDQRRAPVPAGQSERVGSVPLPRARQTKIALTPELRVALQMAISCCHEIGNRNQSDYEIEANAAAAEIERALQATGRFTR